MMRRAFFAAILCGLVLPSPSPLAGQTAQLEPGLASAGQTAQLELGLASAGEVWESRSLERLAEAPKFGGLGRGTALPPVRLEPMAEGGPAAGLAGVAFEPVGFAGPASVAETGQAAPGAALAAALLDLAPHAGQTAPALVPGSRVRVNAPAVHGGALIGQFEGLDAAGLRVHLQTGGVITVPRDAVTRIETSEGPRPNKLRGAVIGGFVGFAGGLVAVAQGREEEDRSFAPGFDRAVEVIGTMALTGVGAGLGTLVGAAIRTERWQEVQLPAPSKRLGLAPTRTGGGRLVVTLPR